MTTYNKRLFGLERYFLDIANLHNNNKLPNKLLLSGKKGIGKSTLAYHLINFFLSTNEDYKYDIKNFCINEKNKSYQLLKSHTHSNFYLIDLLVEKKSIDIDQIRKMINYANKLSFNKLPRFILIDNIEHLNLNSANALLKIIEEPYQNLFFILIHDNSKKILPTLNSRCLTFKIYLAFEETIKITNSILQKDINELLNPELINYYHSPSYLISLIDFSIEKKINLNDFTLIRFIEYLIDNSFYKKNKFIKDLLIEYIEVYFFKIYRYSNEKNYFFKTYSSFVKSVYDSKKYNLDEESLFIEFKSKVLNG